MLKKIFLYNLLKSPSRNYLGAIQNFVKLNNDDENKCIFCVVDLHAVTTKQDPKDLRNNIRETVATFLASEQSKKILFSTNLK